MRINTIGEYLKERFGTKVIKLSLDGGFTCPNRDGSKGTGGCIFCSEEGSGDFASAITAEGIKEAMKAQAKLLSLKWPEAKYIAYFQSYTNTYAPLAELKNKFEAALSTDLDVVGLAIATRPDCLSEEILDYLEELNNRTFLWIELGLQTCHDKTGKLINRCYDSSVYEEAVKNLGNRKIRVVTHLILGLPGESRQDMLESVGYVCKPLSSFGVDKADIKPADTGASEYIFGLKLHLLNVIRGSCMELEYPDYVAFESIDDYVNLVVEALRIIPQDITIHRMTADTKRSSLISPEWSYRKRTILNGIHNRMRQLEAKQGDKL